MSTRVRFPRFSGKMFAMASASCLLAVCLGVSPVLKAAPSEPDNDEIPSLVYQQAVESFQQGKVTEAESVLRPALRDHPHDARALGLLGVILDAEQRYDEAESVYKKALKLAPPSVSLLNNLGNHYLARGDQERAREEYLRVVGIEPNRANANLRLAEMSVAAKDGNAALRYLDHLQEDAGASPPAQLLRAKALHLGGQSPAAEGVLNQLEARNGGDPRLSFSVGLVYVEWQLYDRAKKAFSRALESEPVNFDVLYNLGLAAAHSGHLDRAEQVFQVALKQKPEDVDALYNLGRVYAERGRDDQAITFFARAGQLAPERRDVLLSMAQAADRLGCYEDAASAIDRYLKLRPDDDVMRRERGFALARTAKIDDALQDLNSYVRKHPKDARGFYELAIAETVQERDMALKHLDRAISLDPNLCAARYARGVLLSQQGKFAESLEDLKLVAGCDPQDYRALGVLGEGYLRLGNDAAAVTALSKAATLAPRNSAVLLQYGRALMKSGRQEEGEAVLEKSKALEPEEARRRPYSGLFSLLSLPPEQQRRRYLATLEKRIAQDPEDASLKARWGQEQLADGKTAEALETFRRVRGMTSSSTILAQCGKALLDREQYGAAQEFPQAAVGVDPSAANTRLNLVVAMFHATGPAAALAELDRIPPVGGRGEGDYYLLRAQVLDAMGKTEEAVDNLNRGFRASPARPDLYFEAALFLIKHARYQEALELITQAKRLVPDARQLLIAEAVIYEVSQRSDFAQKILEQIQTQWPEWSPPYLLNGLFLKATSNQRKPGLNSKSRLPWQVMTPPRIITWLWLTPKPRLKTSPARRKPSSNP